VALQAQNEEAKKRQAERQEAIAKQNQKREPSEFGGETFVAKVEEEAEPAQKRQTLQSAKTFLFEDDFIWKGAPYRKGDVGAFDSRTVEEMMNSEEPLPLREISGLDEAAAVSPTIARPGEASVAGPPAMAGTPLERPRDATEEEKKQQGGGQQQQEAERRRLAQEAKEREEREEREERNRRAKK
jgi:hypothetical protein